MIDATGWEWVCNKNELICRNLENNIDVKFNKIGNTYNGKLDSMPLELFREISKLEHGERIIEKIVRSAEKVFFKAQLENLL